MGILKFKNCFITGATGTLGKHLAIRLAKESCNLFITGRNAHNLENIKRDLLLLNKDIEVFYKKGDLECDKDIYNIIGECRQKFSSIDILINNAAIFDTRSIFDSSIEFFDLNFKVNVKAPFIFCKEFVKDMLKNNWGRIVNIGSIASYKGFADNSVYCLTKHALLGFSRSLFLELKDKNIRTYLIAPHTMKTEMGKIVSKFSNEDMSNFINPEEVADYIVFVVSFDKQMIPNEIKLNRISFNDHF